MSSTVASSSPVWGGAEGSVGLLDGKVAFVTGAARGMGRNHAVRLAREGASVIGIDIAAPTSPHNGYPATGEADIKETARLLEAEGCPFLVEVADVRDSAALDEILAKAFRHSVDVSMSWWRMPGSTTGVGSGRCRTTSGRR